MERLLCYDKGNWIYVEPLDYDGLYLVMATVNYGTTVELWKGYCGIKSLLGLLPAFKRIPVIAVYLFNRNCTLVSSTC